MVESDMSRIDFFYVFNFLWFVLFVCLFFLRFLSERGASEAQKVSFYCNNGTPKKKSPT